VIAGGGGGAGGGCGGGRTRFQSLKIEALYSDISNRSSGTFVCISPLNIVVAGFSRSARSVLGGTPFRGLTLILRTITLPEKEAFSEPTNPIDPLGGKRDSGLN